MSHSNKQTETLLSDDSIGQKDLTDIYKVFQQNTANTDPYQGPMKRSLSRSWEDGNNFLELQRGESWGTFSTNVEGNCGAEE